MTFEFEQAVKWPPPRSVVAGVDDRDRVHIITGSIFSRDDWINILVNNADRQEEL
ncbi:MAG TPA: hypothetical protein VMW87_14185 [Spirochaetia bacterium]|nr:hypothetical protein [Spirochaetia bacterium]